MRSFPKRPAANCRSRSPKQLQTLNLRKSTQKRDWSGIESQNTRHRPKITLKTSCLTQIRCPGNPKTLENKCHDADLPVCARQQKPKSAQKHLKNELQTTELPLICAFYLEIECFCTDFAMLYVSCCSEMTYNIGDFMSKHSISSVFTQK